MDIESEFIEAGEYRECARCALVYRELDNRGTHTCRYHPGTLIGYTGSVDHVVDTYTCCGFSPAVNSPHYHVRYGRAGCTRCDHVERARVALPPPLSMNEDRARVLLGASYATLPGATLDARTREVLITRSAAAPECVRNE